MEPVIIDKPKINLVGMSFYGDPFDTRSGWDEENEIGRVWSRFMTYYEDNQDQIRHITDPGAAFEVHIYNPETTSLGFFEVFVGFQVDQIEYVPVELLVKILPSTKYAVFTFQGEEISTDWVMQIDGWIKDAGYQRAHPFSFQYLDHRFKGVDRLEELALDVYMPVQEIIENN